MKILTLQNNEWKERVNPNITSEEEAILNDENSDSEIKNTILNAIDERSYQPISSEEFFQAENLYNENKIQDAELIDVNITIPIGRGIINCRLNGEHKQIRF